MNTESQIAKEVIKYLTNLAIEDKLPQDISQLSEVDLSKVVQPFIERLESVLRTIREDANMALSDEWDRSDDGFESQISVINSVINE